LGTFASNKSSKKCTLGRVLKDDASAVASTITPTSNVIASPAELSPPAQPLTFNTKDKILLSACAAFVISNMDKVNISIAIMPMAQEFGWSSGVAGFVQSSFFAGYLLMQVPGGYLASRLGGRRILPLGLATWSSATALVPIMASTVASLCFSRAVVGLGEAVAPTSIVDMIARTVRKEERSSAVSLAFTGLHIGSIIGLLAAPLLINSLGWRALFVVFGSAGLVWYVGFESFMAGLNKEDPETARKLTTPMKGRPSEQQQQQPVPYRAFLRSPAVQAVCFTHYANNWFHFTMLAWVPTYFTDVLGLQDLTHAAQTSLLPPIAGIACSLVAGPMADALIARGTSVAVVRKVMQNIAFLGPLVCMCYAVYGTSDGPTQVGMVTAALGLSSFALAGLYCTHQDMAAKYAGALLGLTNTAGALSGVMGVSAVGILFDATHSWDAALFLPNVAFLAAGSACFTLFGRHEPIDFDAADNSPFWFEGLLEAPRTALADASAALVRTAERLLPRPSQADVKAARRARLATASADAASAAAASTIASTLLQSQPASSGGSLGNLSSGSPSTLPASPAFTSLTLSSWSDMTSGRSLGVPGGGDPNRSSVLVSYFTSASVTPDFDDFLSEEMAISEELTEAEEEVERIMREMQLRNHAPAAQQTKAENDDE